MTVVNGRIYKYLKGVLPIPDHMILGHACKHDGHSMNGHTIRYLNGGKCVLCMKATHKRIAQRKALAKLPVSAVSRIELDRKLGEIADAKALEPCY